jgi:hypothetical protein
METKKFKFIKDQYRINRGGSSRFLNNYCEHCKNFILLYQKDGPGPLKRMYLDRIIAPENLSNFQNKKEIPNLICNHCKRIIAVPSIYESENRRAYALLAYMIIKKFGKGIYPPQILKLEE